MREVITERDIPLSGELKYRSGAIITMAARDLAAARGVSLIEMAEGETAAAAGAQDTVALGADHGGFELKEALKAILEEFRLSITDVGVFDTKPADYPDIAENVAKLVASGTAARGVVIDGAGIGSCMAANKIPGVRAALCYDKASARNSREHNDSNVLTLGSRLLTQTQAEDVLRIWLGTPFAGGRHSARVQKISRIEQRYANWTPQN
ncbi:MAG TPA: ribose 5-phosphate isomerase B [Bryobacteraceae bacterium]|nr:ribose 5-phosphate isomerase B [Bryobacteraceae bacterium]